MDTMKLIVYITTAVVLLLSGSQAESDTPPPIIFLNTTVTTTPHAHDRVLSPPHNDTHGVDDSKTTDDDDDDNDGDDDDDADDESLHPNDDSDVDDDDEKYPAPRKVSDDGKYPNPQKDPKACNIGDKPAWLCNKDNVLTDDTAQNLNELLQSMVDAKGICPCQKASCSYTGFPMAVVVLEDIPDYENKSQEEKEAHVHQLARRFLHDWDFNTCNDGAVTVVVASEEIAETVIGPASEYLVPDDCEDAVDNATAGLFEDGQLVEGLTKLIQQYRLIVSKDHSCNSDDYLKKGLVIPIIVIIALILLAVIVAVVVLIYRRRGSRDLKRTEANVPLKDQQHTEKA